jgi:holo-[acyl-carrier protein] synthase
MALTVGIDLVSIDRVQESVSTHADRYLHRVFSAQELRDCTTPDGTLDVRRLAARFAAKEATLKVLRAGDEAIPWSSVAVHVDSFGRPSIELTGAASELARARNIEDLAVSITHEDGFAAAIVLAHRRGDT